MDDATSTLYSAAQALRTGGKAEVRAALLRARQRTLLLARAWADALGTALAVPQRPTLNPPLWELGHVAWFQEHWLGRNPARAQGCRLDTEERAPSLLDGADRLYDSSHVPHATRWSLPLPHLAATEGYLAQVLEQSLRLLDAVPEDAGEDALYFFRLAALHEEMHAEAGVYMARGVGVEVARELKDARPHPDPLPQAGEGGRQLRVEGQTFALGWSGPGFAFDNELQAHPVTLARFEIDAQAVPWGRYVDFIDAAGYRDGRWWDEAGARWLAGTPGREAAVAARAGPVDAPAVHLTAHEARAWCAWAGRRLPTEAEWECAALTQAGFHWGTVWEWTASPFLPYPGFVPHPYRDYSAPWFGSRVVLRGACRATGASLAHPRYRNFFEPQRDDVFGGFRSCAAAGPAAAV